MKKKNIWTLSLTTYLLIVTLIATAITGCGLRPKSATPTPTLASEIVFYDWEDDLPEQVLKAFTAEYGVEVKYLTYLTQEEAIENLKAGKVYDVVVFDNRFIPGLVRDNLISEIDLNNIPNMKNLSPTFCHFPFDAQGNYRVPFNWGTVGLLMRDEFGTLAPLKWQDLWSPILDSKVILWKSMLRENVGMSLKSLGYSINSEDPNELEAALNHLIKLKPQILFGEDVDEELDSITPILADGLAMIGMGESYDYYYDPDYIPNLHFILPEDGAILFADNFTIPSNSPNHYTAELFVNFLLRPEIGALITNENHYPTPNDAARAYVTPEILASPAVYPDTTEISSAEIIMPLSPEGEKLYAEIWERFLAAEP